MSRRRTLPYPGLFDVMLEMAKTKSRAMRMAPLANLRSAKRLDEPIGWGEISMAVESDIIAKIQNKVPIILFLVTIDAAEYDQVMAELKVKGEHEYSQETD